MDIEQLYDESFSFLINSIQKFLDEYNKNNNNIVEDTAKNVVSNIVADKKITEEDLQKMQKEIQNKYYGDPYNEEDAEYITTTAGLPYEYNNI
jgi:predicted patatin/cPLA2 family phospholipase